MSIRKTADERRAEILKAAMEEFSRFGYYGGSTERIAAACEISQPYVLRLFGSKLKLFLATLDAVTTSIQHRWSAALEGREEKGWPALMILGSAYATDDTGVEFQMILQGVSAADVPEILEASNACMDTLWTWVETHTQASFSEIQRFWAFGMMQTIAFAMNAPRFVETSERARAMVIPPQG